jgi:hypothetical protein
MKPKLLAERGQALILIALAAIGLVAVTALAIDGSAKYSDRRHAQNAADASSLAAALEKTNLLFHGFGVHKHNLLPGCYRRGLGSGRGKWL